MPQEIEHKFLVKSDFKPFAYTKTYIVQGYLNSASERTVRIRLEDENGYITIKGKNSENGLTRYEWEKEISAEEAKELLGLCEPGVIEKVRYRIKAGKHIYEVDEFEGENKGLVMAEIELSSEDETFEKPDWLGKEVTGDKRYYNSSLSKKPYKDWHPE